MKWFQRIIQIFKTKDVRKKIFFDLGILLFFRLMSNIPVPGVNVENLKEFFEQFGMFRLLNVFTGGSLDQLSIVMLGVGPYITAVIILQLLTMIFPSLEEIYKEEGEGGRQKFNQYGRILSIPLAMLQAYAMLNLFQRRGVISQLSSVSLLASILTIATGSALLMWLGELITEYGIGDGISLLIFAGIIARTPVNIGEMISKAQVLGQSTLYSYLIFFGISLIVIAGVVLVNEARRNISISYAKRVRGSRVYGGASTFLPLNVNPAGVMPIIFALSILTFPSMIVSFIGEKTGILGLFIKSVNSFFNNPWAYGTSYFLLVCLFTYFYTAVTFDPQAVSKNLQKMGAFVPGIRPGNSTANYLSFILNRVLLLGALFLGAIAIMPEIVANLTQVGQFSFLVGGTSLLIVVGVVLDLTRQINTELEMREYEKL
ncbi:preprotein translocase subunit SecY [Parcubacteria bacterium DG_74_2]|nr:MAG: preprotein translocase subunit SecY [Parcubacteria bacterium DG_74_2]